MKNKISRKGSISEFGVKIYVTMGHEHRLKGQITRLNRTFTIYTGAQWHQQIYAVIFARDGLVGMYLDR